MAVSAVLNSAMAAEPEAGRTLEREWWLRLPYVLQRPREVFAALRDDSDAAAGARHEPILLVGLLAGVAGVLASNQIGRALDDFQLDGVDLAVVVFLGALIYSVAAYFVLGPLVVEEELNGARDWGIALTGGAVGGIVGSALALRFRPRYPLRWSFIVILPISLQLLALIPPVPAAGLFFAAVLAVTAIALANVLWNTTLQERIPEHALSRVSAYDWMVSLVFMPVGYAIAGPLSDAIGVDETLALAAGISLVANLSMLLVPDVRNLRRLGDEDGEAMPGPVALSPAEPA